MSILDPRNMRILLVGLILCLTAGGGMYLVIVSAMAPPSSGLRTTESVDEEDAGGTYTVTMSPVGTVRFAQPPERVVTMDDNYNDMLVAVGRGSKLIATGYENNRFDGFYVQLPDVDTGIDARTIQYLSGNTRATFDKELLYELDADIHHIDPLRLTAGNRWTRTDIEEITRNVGPFFANRYSRENIYPGTEPYEFYSVWELADKVGQVYRQSAQTARLKEIGDELIRSIQAKLPPPEERPTVGLVYYSGRGNLFTPYSMGHGGFGQAQYAAIGAKDAFEGLNLKTYGESGGRGASLDLEGLLSIDPDVLIVPLAIYGKPGSGLGGRAAYERLLALKDDPLGRRLSAMQHDRVYPGGTPLQGPVFYIFQIEMAAKQICPELFGRYRDDHRYPRDEWLFDRDAVAKILRGEDDHAGS